MDPVTAAAAMQGASGLLTQIMQQQMAEEAAARKAKLDREQMAASRLAQAEQSHLGAIQGMGQGEQSALGNLIAALQRTVR